MSGRSQWLADVADELPSPIALSHDLSVDVAIIGGGYVGLWTAITLKEMEPGLRIAVLEMDRCGSGASGLNGGFVMSWWPKIASLTRVCGQDDALWLVHQLNVRAADGRSRQRRWGTFTLAVVALPLALAGVLIWAAWR